MGISDMGFNGRGRLLELLDEAVRKELEDLLKSVVQSDMLVRAEHMISGSEPATSLFS